MDKSKISLMLSIIVANVYVNNSNPKNTNILHTKKIFLRIYVGVFLAIPENLGKNVMDR